MDKESAFRLFGGKYQLAKALSISRQAVEQWPDVLDEPRVDRVVGAAVRTHLAFPRYRALLEECRPEEKIELDAKPKLPKIRRARNSA